MFLIAPVMKIIVIMIALVIVIIVPLIEKKKTIIVICAAKQIVSENARQQTNIPGKMKYNLILMSFRCIFVIYKYI